MAGLQDPRLMVLEYIFECYPAGARREDAAYLHKNSTLRR